MFCTPGVTLTPDTLLGGSEVSDGIAVVAPIELVVVLLLVAVVEVDGVILVTVVWTDGGILVAVVEVDGGMVAVMVVDGSKLVTSAPQPLLVGPACEPAFHVYIVYVHAEFL